MRRAESLGMNLEYKHTKIYQCILMSYQKYSGTTSWWWGEEVWFRAEVDIRDTQIATPYFNTWRNQDPKHFSSLHYGKASKWQVEQRASRTFVSKSTSIYIYIYMQTFNPERETFLNVWYIYIYIYTQTFNPEERETFLNVVC